LRKKYYEDPKENATFERCVDVMTDLILKYGPVLKRTWTWKTLLGNVWMDLVCDHEIVKRLSEYRRLSKIKEKDPGEKAA
jgi:hypothetical protein